MKISLIIPVYNALADVKVCLESIEKNYDKSYEFIVVDDCSAQDTADFLKEFARDRDFVRLYRNEENLGFIKTCNFAMKQARGDIVVLLNSDTQIPSMFAEKIIDCFAKSKRAGVACPIPSHSGHFSLEMPKNCDIEKMNALIEAKHKCTYPRLHSCNGFCFCIRRELLNKIGYFDEIFGRGYCEEIDFCFRAIKEGFDCVLIDNLYVIHKRHASFGGAEREKILRHNQEIFNARWGDFANLWRRENNYKCPVKNIEKEVFFMRVFWAKFKKFLYQDKSKPSGYRLIKICKIPVYRKKPK